MFGFLVGLLAAGAFVMFMKRRMHRRWRRARGRGRGRGWQGMRVEMVKRRLNLDEDQADLAEHAMVDVKESLRSLRADLREVRADLADVFVAPEVDDAALDAAFARFDEAVQRARQQVVVAARQVHAALDDDQRSRVAGWLRRRRDADVAHV